MRFLNRSQRGVVPYLRQLIRASYSTLHRILSSALERIKDKLRDSSGRIGTWTRGSKEDTKVFSGLVDDVRDAVTDSLNSFVRRGRSYSLTALVAAM
jgi:hypothetical protein